MSDRDRYSELKELLEDFYELINEDESRNDKNFLQRATHEVRELESTILLRLRQYYRPNKP